MSDNDAKWIDLCESLNKKFKIIVDNDKVYVVDTATDEEVYTFSEYGLRFALGLLRYIGCNAEEVYMDIREKPVELFYDNNVRCDQKIEGLADDVMDIIANGVTAQGWIPVKDHTPTEADGTVWVYLADVFPYNEKEPYIDAKHDRRITEAKYSQFSKQWYKEGAIFPEGVVTHWMEKPQPPKGE